MTSSYRRLRDEYDENYDVFESFIETAYDEEIESHIDYLDDFSNEDEVDYEGWDDGE